MKMLKVLFNKLIRDRMPEVAAQRDGAVIHCKTLNDEEYDSALRAKIVEEALEVAATTSKQELIEELADLFEVIDALKIVHGISLQEIQAIQEAKRLERGGFANRTFAITGEFPEGSYGAQYCREQPEKYPEIKD